MKTEIEKRCDAFLKKRNDLKDTINAMMQMKKVRVDVDKKEISLAFQVHDWQLNPAQTMHGGILCTIMDMSMAAIAYSFSDAFATPTISLSANFVCAVNKDERLLATSIVDHVGKKIVQTRVIVCNQDGKIVATANGSYAIHRKKS